MMVSVKMIMLGDMFGWTVYVRGITSRVAEMSHRLTQTAPDSHLDNQISKYSLQEPKKFTCEY